MRKKGVDFCTIRGASTCINEQGNKTTKNHVHCGQTKELEKKSLSTCTEATNANSAPESLTLNKQNYRRKKNCDCKSSMIFAHHHDTKQFEITKMNCAHTGHATFGVVQDETPESVKHEAREQLKMDSQSPSSVLLSMERKHDLNISSKAIFNLKDRDMGKRSKHLCSNDDVDKMICDSTVLIQNLSTDHGVACVANYESCCDLKMNKNQVKSFDSNSPVDVIGNVCDFLIENIENSIHSNSSNRTHTNMFHNDNTTCKLVEMSWVNEKQHTRAKRNLEVQMIDAACKTNSKGRLLGYFNSVDGENKSILTLISLLKNETSCAFNFILTCLGFARGKKHTQ